MFRDNLAIYSVSNSIYRNCHELQSFGHRKNSIYTIRPYDCCPERTVDVFCDLTTDGGGWTIIQRRAFYWEHEDFFRTWKEYVEGFGQLKKEFWLGLEHIHALTNQSDYEARFDLADFGGYKRFAKYDTFSVGDQDLFYRLEIGGYSGDAGDSMSSHTATRFSTKDNGNTHCAIG